MPSFFWCVIVISFDLADAGAVRVRVGSGVPRGQQAAPPKLAHTCRLTYGPH